MEYLKLAKKQFSKMKEECLDEDRHCCGGENEINYTIEGDKFTIKVNGFWESSDWFDWEVINNKGEKIEFGTEY